VFIGDPVASVFRRGFISAREVKANMAINYGTHLLSSLPTVTSDISVIPVEVCSNAFNFYIDP